MKLLRKMKLFYKRRKPDTFLEWSALWFLVALIVPVGMMLIIAFLEVTGAMEINAADFWSMFTLAAFIASVVLAIHGHNVSLKDNFKTVPEGYMPSRELDKIIYMCYIKRCGEMEQLPVVGVEARFTTYLGDTDVLRALVPNSFSYELNIGTYLYHVKYMYEEQPYYAVSGSLQMAICIAFLRSTGSENRLLIKNGPL